MSKEDLKYFMTEWIEATERLGECAHVIGKEKMKQYSDELKATPWGEDMKARMMKLDTDYDFLDV